ncbi:tetratricopeptide repeat protein [[Phormidium] sp. ETS-05]|uniref:tetratricopeptide repeat protein n=1 Tax=[Phormidium] sp. ETS-05 TaxID=222819 RepID=UPI0018EF0006|nr:tetratricopeptide repeat protein [[Phormidium] sp. ETS-05]
MLRQWLLLLSRPSLAIGITLLLGSSFAPVSWAQSRKQLSGLTATGENYITQNTESLQKNGTLEPGDRTLERDGSLYDMHIFSGKAGQTITITLESPDFDTYLILLDAEGNKLADNDDVAENNSNSTVTATLPADGDYAIIVNGYDANSRGNYTLTVTPTTAPQPNPQTNRADTGNSEADRLVQEGLRLFQQGTAESLRAALEKLSAARQLYHAAGNPAREALTLLGMGRINDDLGDKQQALSYYNQALPLFRQVGDKRGEALALNNIGLVYSNLGDQQQALSYYNQALPLFRQVGDKGGEAMTLNNIGGVYDALGDKQQALSYYNQALPLFRQVGDKGGEATTLNNIGGVYDALGDKQQALSYYNQALPLFRQVGDKGGEATTLNNIGGVYDALGDKQLALNYYNQALPLYRQVGDKGGEAAALNNIGAVYSDLGDKQLALNYYNQALPLYRQVGDKGGEAAALNNIGAVYNSLGDQQQALNYYNQALPLLRQVEDKRGEATTLNNIGGVYSALGDKQQALNYYNQALPLLRQVGDKGGEAAALNNIGAVYSELGDKQQALSYYNQALPLYKQVGDKGGEATILNGIGGVYSALGDKQQALSYYNQALPLVRQVGYKGGEAAALNNIGGVYSALGDKQQALSYYNQALPLLRQVGDKQGEAAALYNLAFTQRSQQQLDAALTNIEAAITIIEDLRSKIISPELRQSYFAENQDAYQFYIDLLMQLHQQQPEKGYDIKAFNASERSRARTLLELLVEANADIRTGADPQLLEQERNIEQQINALEVRRIELSNRPNSQPEIEQLKAQEANLLQQRRDLANQIRAKSPKFAALKYPQPLTLAQVQQQVLDENTILLQYSLGQDRSYLWAVTKNGFTTHILPGEQDIITAVTQFRDIILDPPSPGEEKTIPPQLITQAQQLSQMLLGPVANELADKRLLFAPDGVLFTLPFNALNLPNATEYAPLISQYEIVTATSSSTVAISRQELAGRTPAPRTLAVIADPVFSADDERITGKKASASSTISLPRALERSLADLNRNSIERLPGSRREGEQILALVPANQSTQAFDFDASKETTTEPDISQYRFIHLATHGFVNTKQPELSGIILSLVDQNGQPENGYLRLNDIFNLNLPAELVVLSACETGLGQEVRGEGLVGLTRGLMYAGARGVVVSLWKVNDDATAELMVKFYQQMLSQNIPAPVALRTAQVQMWQKWQHPRYWAAFTIQGEWR